MSSSVLFMHHLIVANIWDNIYWVLYTHLMYKYRESSCTSCFYSTKCLAEWKVLCSNPSSWDKRINVCFVPVFFKAGQAMMLPQQKHACLSFMLTLVKESDGPQIKIEWLDVLRCWIVWQVTSETVISWKDINNRWPWWG